MSLGAPVQAAGALYQGQAQSAALNQQASIQRANAQLDLEKGNADAGRQQIMAGEKIGNIEGAASAAGVTESGSVLSVLGASAQNSEMDRLNILHGADVRSINAENQASMDSLGATSAMKGAYMSAFGSLMQGAGSTFANTQGANSAGGSTGNMDYTDSEAQNDVAAENEGVSTETGSSALSTEAEEVAL